MPRPSRNGTWRISSLKYLVSAYNPDKLNDPAQAEPVLISMIQRDPADPQGYFMLANVYEQAGEYPDAERVFLLARDAKPEDPEVYLQLAGYYNRQGQFEKTIEALEKRAERESKNPEAFQMIGGYYEEEVRSDTRLTDPQKSDVHREGSRGGRQGARIEQGLRRSDGVQRACCSGIRRGSRRTLPNSSLSSRKPTS